MAIEVRMPNKAAGDPGIDELRPRYLLEVMALLVRQVLRPQLTYAAQTKKQVAREPNRLIVLRDVDGRPFHPQAHVLGSDPLGDHLQVEIGGGQHDILDVIDGS